MKIGDTMVAAATVYRTFGARGVRLRLQHEIRRRTGRFRRAPRYSAPSGTPRFRLFEVDAARLADATNHQHAVSRADRIVGGEYEAYRWDWRRLPDTSAAWCRHPTTDVAFPADIPWWQVRHLDPQAGDIKDLWEPARFGWVYDLVRAYLITGNDRYPRAFHRILAEWLEACPPMRGPHWSCGQEAAIRALALLYAETNFRNAESTTEEATRTLEFVLSASGERIRDAFGYALSQRNNHAISEAVGLLILGLRFTELHPEAREWERTGRLWLDRLIHEQFATDGWYIQHSFTYLRLALDMCVAADLALRAGSESGIGSLSRERLAAAVRLLLAVIEPDSGIVPNHGANDGAFVHPITLADYRDFRPVLTAACSIWSLPFPDGIEVDRETLSWLGSEAPRACGPLNDGICRGESGWVSVRNGRVFVFLRAGAYTSRPGHVDPLHLDIRIDSRELIVDPGTFSYNAPYPWRNGLSIAGVHNGPIVDAEEPGVRGPRFLWYRWPRARMVTAGQEDSEVVLVAERAGVARRTVYVTANDVRIDDEVLKPDARIATVRWLLHPDAELSRVELPGGTTEHAGDGVTGWFSPYYGMRAASRCVTSTWSPADQAQCRTIIHAWSDVPSSGSTRESGQTHLSVS